MKKIVLICLASVICFSFAACSKSENDVIVDVPNAPTALTEPSPSSIVDNNDSPATDYDAEAIKEEANIAWDAFLEVVAVMETDPAYSTIIKVYENTETVYSQHYQTVLGRNAQEYIDLTSFEKFLWYSTYITPAIINANTSDYETYFGTLAKWNSNVVGNTYQLLKNQGATEQAEAYKTLMEWQYNFFVEHGMMYNFITQQTSVEENPAYVIPARPTK